MTAAKIAITEKSYQFIQQYGDDHCCLEILRFFGEYPHARFSQPAVAHALESNPGKLYTRRALKKLVDKGVLKKHDENNVSLYSLAEDESICSMASFLAKLDWRQWRAVFGQTYRGSGELSQIGV